MPGRYNAALPLFSELHVPGVRHSQVLVLYDDQIYQLLHSPILFERASCRLLSTEVGGAAITALRFISEDRVGGRLTE